MARKIHLRRNKNTELAPVAACATNPNLNKVARNQRSSYQFMASQIVDWQDFVNVAAAERCALCVEAGLTIRNRQRKAKGLAPLNSLFEKTDSLKTC